MMTFFKNKYAGLIFNISICLVISCSSYDFSSVFSTLPVKPQAGETVTMLYNPKGTVLESSNKVSAQSVLSNSAPQPRRTSAAAYPASAPGKRY